MIIRVRQHVRAPPADVFAWCTDYREDDAGLSSVRLRGRRVLRRDGHIVELEDDGVLGMPLVTRYVVRLHPPDRWEADGRSRMGSTHNDYHLAPETDGTRIEITFDIRPRGRYRLIAPFARGILRRRLSRLWADLAHAMESDR